MRLKPRVKVEKSNGLWTVRLYIGVQSFTFDYHASREECRWYASRVRFALRVATTGLTKEEEKYIKREEALRTYDGTLS